MTNGALDVVPGTHTLDQLPHRDTFDAENRLSRGLPPSTRAHRSHHVTSSQIRTHLRERSLAETPLTWLVLQRCVELPAFAANPLAGATVDLETPSWRANPVWANVLGRDLDTLGPLGLQSVVAGFERMVCGANSSVEQRSQGFDDGFMIDFVDTSARYACPAHPDHQRAGAALVATGHPGRWWTCGTRGVRPR